MMKRSNIIKLAPIAALALGAGACDEGWTGLTELNENPNAPTTVAPALIFTEGTQEAASAFLGNSFNMDYGEHIAQHLAEIAYPEEDIYQYRNTEIDGQFRNAYGDFLMDFQEVIDLGRANEQPNAAAAGLIMKSWSFHNLTDIWGDLPYSMALKGDSTDRVIVPAYDPQQEIYAGLLADLASASALIDPASDPFGAQDLVYGGDMAGWQKFANSLRLRVAMRMADVDDATARAEFNAALSAAGGVFTSNADNADICYTSVTRNPWFTYYQGRPNDFRVSATLVDTLTSFSDPRLAVYVQPIESDSVDGEPVADTVYRGMPSGMLDGHGYKPAETSYPGEYFLSQTACHPLMTYGEVLFLRAEAAQRGWTTDDAAALYEQAITASMERWDIPEDEINAYLAQSRVQYTAGPWQQQIGLQKWIALYGQGLEAFAEARRLDYPVLAPGPGAVLDAIPARYPYPFSEETFNGTNLSEAKSRQGITTQESGQTARLWWDVK